MITVFIEHKFIIGEYVFAGSLAVKLPSLIKRGILFNCGKQAGIIKLLFAFGFSPIRHPFDDLSGGLIL